MNKLTDFKKGSKVKIAQITAGYGAKRNLMNLGLSEGNIIEIKRISSLKGPVVVLLDNTEIAIGHGLAQKISVEGI
ncbi:ferrous iron transport protein A [Bacteroidota bacterium]